MNAIACETRFKVVPNLSLRLKIDDMSVASQSYVELVDGNDSGHADSSIAKMLPERVARVHSDDKLTW